MKKLHQFRITLIAMAVLAFSSVGKLFASYAPVPQNVVFRAGGRRGKQGGFVLLGRNYAGYAAGTIVELPASTEAALIASGGATTSAGPATAGAVTTTALQGSVTIGAGTSSLVVTNASVTPQSIIYAIVAQAAADGTLLRVERVVASAGFFTIYGTANATAAVIVDWAILNPTGALTTPT